MPEENPAFARTAEIAATEIRVGATASLQRIVLEIDVVNMAEISGDYNSAYLDEDYAKTTRFGKRISHGLFCLSMISALLGNTLPGRGTIIVTETVRFLRPVYLGDTITAEVTVEAIEPLKDKVKLSFECRNQNGIAVMSGETLVVVPFT